jgi:adenylyltransferase/sulfurtransferase
MEAIKVLAEIEPQSKGKLMVFDFAQSEFRTIELRIRTDCSVCQIKAPSVAAYPSKLAWLCGSDTANVNPEEPLSLDLPTIATSIGRKHSLLLTTPMVIVFDYMGHEVSLFRKGRMLIKNVKDEAEALKISRSIFDIVTMG